MGLASGSDKCRASPECILAAHAVSCGRDIKASTGSAYPRRARSALPLLRLLLRPIHLIPSFLAYTFAPSTSHVAVSVRSLSKTLPWNLRPPVCAFLPPTLARSSLLQQLLPATHLPRPSRLCIVPSPAAPLTFTPVPCRPSEPSTGPARSFPSLS